MAATNTIEKAYCPECGEQFEPGTKNCPNDGSRLYSYQVRDASDDPLVGRTIDDRFRIDSVLGEGGMGRVYRGVQLSVERSVAIKVLRPELVDREDVIQRFLREARVISGFSHPNIVNLVDFGQDPEHDVLYLAMELLDGLPLSDVMMRGRAHPNLVCEIAIQVCRALAEAHSREIVHRDLKPDNLMVVPMSDGSLQVKVLDFGIAHAVQGEKRLTSTGQVFGTAHYMAPEQASGKEVGPSTDIYALGCILYELLCGKLPFDAPSVMGLLVAHVQQQPPHLVDRLRDDDIPKALVDLVMETLSKEISDRPASVLQVRDRVEKIRADARFGPVRVAPGEKLERSLFMEWLRGEHSARLRETSEPLNRATGDHDRNTFDGGGLATAETAAHPSAPSIDEVPDFGPPTPANGTGGSGSSGATPAPALVVHPPSHSGPQEGPRGSDSSIELELARVEENRRLYLLAGGLVVVLLVVAYIAFNLATSVKDSNAVIAATDAGIDVGKSVAAAETPPQTDPDNVAAEKSVDAGVAAVRPAIDAGRIAAEAANDPNTDTVEKTVEKKPVEKKPVEKKPVEKKPVEKKPVEKKPDEKKTVNTVDLPI